jgi:hypothetical protein
MVSAGFEDRFPARRELGRYVGALPVVGAANHRYNQPPDGLDSWCRPAILADRPNESMNSATELQPELPPRTRRWLQYSLRTLLVVVLLGTCP